MRRGKRGHADRERPDPTENHYSIRDTRGRPSDGDH